jgi:hypothetical protein
MTGLRTTIAAAMLVALLLCVSSESKVVEKRATFEIMTMDQFLQTFCQNSLFSQYWYACPASTTTAATSTTNINTVPAGGNVIGGQTTSPSPTVPTATTTPSASALQRAHWCSFNNGSYIPLGYTFMYTACSMCQCTQSRSILCTNLQCVAAYCIDGSTPSARPGQCCQQCGYEPPPTACSYGGITFPHGTVLKVTGDSVECWCQLGTVECRKGAASVLGALDLWGPGTAAYAIVLIVCVILIVGTLLCCAGGIFFYYYYYYYQRNLQAVDPYWNNAGWQPMNEEEQAAEASAEAKQAEADQSQFVHDYPTEASSEYIPPPYALYNGAYPTEEQAKDQKYI